MYVEFVKNTKNTLQDTLCFGMVCVPKALLVNEDGVNWFATFWFTTLIYISSNEWFQREQY